MTVVDVPLVAGEAVTAGDDGPLTPGTEVEVRSRLDGHWARGFEVVAADGPGYRLRRLSDGRELPTTFRHDDVRLRERKRGTWWY